MRWQQLVKELDLEGEVREFVYRRARERLSAVVFKFEGELVPLEECAIPGGHPPHTMPRYRVEDDLKRRWVPAFCTGREGPRISGERIRIVYEHVAVFPYNTAPASISGFWWIEREEEKEEGDAQTTDPSESES